MPGKIKRNYRKKPTVKKTYKRTYRGKRKNRVSRNPNIGVNRTKPMLKQLFPSRYFTELNQISTIDFQPSSNKGYMDILLNNLLSPSFASGTYGSDYQQPNMIGTGSTIETPYQLGTAITQQPTGISMFMNSTTGSTTMYSAGRVNAASITCEITENTGASINFACFPYTYYNNHTGSSNMPQTVDGVSEMAYGKRTQLNLNASRKILKTFIKMRTLLGVSKHAIDNDLSGNSYTQLFQASGGFTTVQPIDDKMVCLWRLCFGSASGISRFTITFKLKQYVEFSNLGSSTYNPGV